VKERERKVVRERESLRARVSERTIQLMGSPQETKRKKLKERTRERVRESV